MGYYDANGIYVYDLGEPFNPSIQNQATSPGASEAPLDVEGMIARDMQAWREMLQQSTHGLNFGDPTKAVEEELPGVLAWVRANPGKDPRGGVDEAIARLKRRGATSATTGGTTTGNPGNGWFGSNAPTTSTSDYKPFTEKFTPSLGALPSDLMDKWTKEFVPPDLSYDALMKDESVQAQIRLGRDAIEASNAARGTFFTPGMLKAIDKYAGDVVSQKQNDLFGRALSTFGTNFSADQSDKARRADVYRGQTMQDFNTWMQNFNINRDNQVTPFTMSQTGKMNDFSIYNTLNQNYYDNLFRQAVLGKVPA